MLRALAIVFALAILGDTIADTLHAPIPGAALGMMLLAVLFGVRGDPDPHSARLFDAAAPYFPLFFVPAASGLVASTDLLASAWVSVATAILLSTLAAIAVTGLLVESALSLLRKMGRT